mgnify:CR=1 FL=1
MAREVKLASGTIVLETGDLEIGAVEIKNDSDDTRAKVGGGVEANALRVTLASDSTGLVSVDDNGASLTVDNAALSVTGTGTAAGGLRVNLATDVALPAGTNLFGKVGIDQTTPGTTNAVQGYAYTAQTSVTRTADTSIYAANDVIGAATGSTAALTFASIGPAAGHVMITDTDFRIDLTGVISGMTTFRLHLYNITPPSALGDNAAWDLPAGDRASYLGYLDLGTIVDLGSTLYVERNGVNKKLLMGATTSLFGYLVTIGTYTPSSADVHTIRLNAVGL